MKRALTALLAMLFAACAHVPARVVGHDVSEEELVPAYVRAVDAAIPTASVPANEPDQWLMAHIDVETTGLVPGYHEMIDVGFVITTLDGTVVDTLFVRVQPEHPERLSPGAAKVNGFDAAKWQSLHALSTKQAVDTIIAFNKRVAGSKHVLLTTFNSWFDTAFLDALMRREGRSWRELFHYFVLDIPSMAWSLGYRDLTNGALAQKFGVADEPRVAEEHTGITGAMLNVRIYQKLQQLQKAPKR